MSNPGLAFGLNLKKKPGASKSAPPRRKPMFGGDDSDSDDDKNNNDAQIQEIGGELGDLTGAESTTTTKTTTTTQPESRKGPKTKNGPPTKPPKMKAKLQANMMFGDLSSTLASRKNAEAATELDSSIYEYDAVYDSLKPKKEAKKEDVERKPKYMKNLLQAAEVRKRDALIAEEKKIAREREAEGEEYAGAEKFVTGAYKKQQEENRLLEEAEKKREEEEAKKNKGGGMSAFYRNMLNKDEQRHSEAVKAAEHMAKDGPKSQDGESGKDAEEEEKRTEADKARELNEKGASVVLNEDGQVVDKRQLLQGGLNVGAKKEAIRREAGRPQERERRDIGGAHGSRKQGMRERQTQMIADQLEQSAKREREEEEEERRLETERMSKSRKTEGEILSAKERYLARKRAAEEAKKGGEAV